MLAFGLLTIRPRIKFDEQTINISTPIKFRILSLFLRIRRVKISRPEKNIKISKRLLYFIKSEEVVPFDKIEYLDYKYEEVEELFTDYRHHRSPDAYEIFSIIACTADQSYTLAKFYGEGARSSRYLFEYNLDFMGTQGGDSLELIELIAKYTDKPIGKMISKTLDYKNLLICIECGRSTLSSLRRCQYCGGELA